MGGAVSDRNVIAEFYYVLGQMVGLLTFEEVRERLKDGGCNLALLDMSIQHASRTAYGEKARAPAAPETEAVQ